MFLFLLTGCGSAATVNNVTISNDDVNSMVKAQKQLMGDVSTEEEKALRINIINNRIDQKILVQEAQKRGIKVSEEDVEAKYQETLKQWKNGGEVQKSLKAQGYTKDNLRDMTIEQLLIQALSNSLVKNSDSEKIAKTQELLVQLRAKAKIEVNEKGM